MNDWFDVAGWAVTALLCAVAICGVLILVRMTMKVWGLA